MPALSDKVFWVGTSLVARAVYKDIVSGKDFSARERPTAFKRRYIKGFQPSRCGIIALGFSSAAPLKCLTKRCPSRDFGF